MEQTTTVTYEALMAALGYTETPEIWRTGWEAAEASFPAEGLPFVTEAFLADVQEICDFSDDILAELRSICARVREDAQLTRLAWLWHTLAFECPTVAAWPNPPCLGAQAAMFPAVVQLSGLPRIFALHRERAIPRSVTRDTCRDLEVWMRHAKRYTGAWGFTRLIWMQHHCAGRLYRIGRLEFIHKPFPDGQVHVYRQGATGAVQALSAPGIRYRRDGLIDGTNDRCEPNAWTATLERDEESVRGYPITPNGRASAEPVTLSLREWAPALLPGDPILDMHIPADGRMHFAECGESMRQALEFFPRYFPEKPVARAFGCWSWLLDSQYEQLLPPNSNIVQFLREFYCFPQRSDDSDPFFRVFGTMPPDLRTAPRDTALRRAMLDFTLTGNRLHMAAGFILIDGLAWGKAAYRR